MDLELSAGAWLTGGYTAEDSDYPAPSPQPYPESISSQ